MVKLNFNHASLYMRNFVLKKLLSFLSLLLLSTQFAHAQPELMGYAEFMPAQYTSNFKKGVQSALVGSALMDNEKINVKLFFNQKAGVIGKYAGSQWIKVGASMKGKLGSEPVDISLIQLYDPETKLKMYEIGVHIADVSYYVTPDSDLDAEAYKRATSVYLPDRVNPMLPEKISNELCSLRPNEDKFTFSAIFQMTDKGEIKQYWLGKTVIHSDFRFAYEDVQQIIETSEGNCKEEILLLNSIAQGFRKKRFAKGAINFSSQEVRFKLDEKAVPIGIMIKESKEAHQLIEELMLLANKTVAENVAKQHINKKPIPFPYRVHDQPDQEKLKPFISFAKKYGHGFDISSAASFGFKL